jgi:hypothetical protein
MPGIEKWLEGWNLSDRIAAIASILALLQFLALVATVLVTIRSTRRQLRAYIVLDGGSITLRQAGGQTFLEGYVRLKNFGQTPAYQHSSWIRIDVREATQPPFDLGGNGLTKAIVAPKGEANMPVHHGPISVQDLSDIRAERKRIFVWGESRYIDAFGKRRFFRFYYWNAKELPQGWPLVPSDKPDEAN